MRAQIIGIALAAFVGCRGSRQIENLPLSWRGVDSAPGASAAVQQALNTTPIALAGIRDTRPDPYAVGRYEDSGFMVRTSDNVAGFATAQLSNMLRAAGARFDGVPVAQLDVELLELNVAEGGMFNGLVRMRVTVVRADAPQWAQVYEGKSKRWGRTHNPENYNEALSNALAEATRRLVQDAAFAAALLGQPAPVVETPVTPVAPVAPVPVARSQHDLSLMWKGVDSAPRASPAVEQALNAVPFALAEVRDTRPDPTAVGRYEDTGYVVRTSDSVAGFTTARLREMLRSAGARFDGAPVAHVDAELLEFNVAEAGMFNGLVRLRITVRRGKAAAWTQIYEGKSKRWGRDHNPENYNEALSNALAEATRRLLQDGNFANALTAGRAPNAGAGQPAPTQL